MPNKKLYKYNAPKAHHPGKLPQSNKFIGELTKARKAGKKSFNVDGKEYMVKMSGGGPHPKNMGYAERFSPENYSERTKAMLYNAPAYPNKTNKKLKNVTAEDQPTDPLVDIQKEIVDLAKQGLKSKDPNEQKSIKNLRKSKIMERDNLLSERKKYAGEQGGPDAAYNKGKSDMEKLRAVNKYR